MNQPPALALQVTRGAAIGVAVGAVVSPPVANIAAAIMVAAFLFVPDWRARLMGFLSSSAGKGVLVFAAALLFGLVVAAFNPQGLAGALPQLVGWRTLFLLAIAFAVFDSAAWKASVAAALVVFSALAAIVAFIVMLSGWTYKGLDPGIILRNQVTQAMIFGVGTFFAGILLFTQRSLARWQRVALATAMLVLLASLIFLQLGRSGSVLLATLVIVMAALMLRGLRRALAVAAVPVVAAIAFTVSPMLQARFLTAWHEFGHSVEATGPTSMGMRLVIWQNSIELIRERPLMGYGLGGLGPTYAAHIKDRATGWQAATTEDPHNQFLSAWLETGMPGLLAFLFLIASLARQPAATPWRQIALALLVAWCVTSMFSSHFQTFNEGHLIAILLGAFLAPLAAAERVAYGDASASATAAATSS